MSRTVRGMRRFWADQSGATAIEYSFIAVLIMVAIVTAVTTVGSKVVVPFNKVGSAMN